MLIIEKKNSYTLLIFRQKWNAEKGIEDAEVIETGKYCEIERSFQKKKQIASCVWVYGKS